MTRVNPIGPIFSSLADLEAMSKQELKVKAG
jgi:hypothetical protein